MSLPAYATVLKERNRNRSPSQNSNSASLTSTEIPIYYETSFDSTNERTTSESQQPLNPVNQEILDLKASIAFEREMNENCKKEIERLEEELTQTRLNTQKAEDQIRQLEIQLQNKRTEDAASERLLSQIQVDVETLKESYEKLQFRNRQSPPRLSSSFDGIVDQSPPLNPNPDTIGFDDNSDLILGLREELARLRQAKEALEWKAQRAPSAGIPVSIARRERMELDEQIGEIDRKMAKIRLQLKQMGIHTM